MRSSHLDRKSVRDEILNYVERKRDAVNSQVKAMEVDNCEEEDNHPSNQDYSDETTWEEWPSNEHELNYMSKGSKGKGKNKGYGKGYSYPSFSYQSYYPKGKGKGDAQKGTKGVMQGVMQEKGKSKGKGFQGQCYWCGEWGHSQSNCWAKDEYMNNLRQQQGSPGKGGHEVQSVDPQVQDPGQVSNQSNAYLASPAVQHCGHSHMAPGGNQPQSGHSYCAAESSAWSSCSFTVESGLNLLWISRLESTLRCPPLDSRLYRCPLCG